MLNFFKKFFYIKPKTIVIGENIYIWLDHITYGKFNPYGWSPNYKTSLFDNTADKLDNISPLYWLTSVGFILIDDVAFQIRLRLEISPQGANIEFDRVSSTSYCSNSQNNQSHEMWCQENASKFIQAHPQSIQDLKILFYTNFYKELDVNFPYKNMKKFLFLNKEKVKVDFLNNFSVPKEMIMALQKCNIKKQKSILSSNITDFLPSSKLIKNVNKI